MVTPSPTALILGITGQDAPYLAQGLLARGTTVVGGYRPRSDGSAPDFSRLQRLGVMDKLTLCPLDANDPEAFAQALAQWQPVCVYNMVANTQVAASFADPVGFNQVNGLNVLPLLEVLRHHAPQVRFCQPGSAQMVGDLPQGQTSVDENGPFNPDSPYGVAKLFAHHTARLYRKAYGLHISCPILFNHESPMRASNFVSKKIVEGVAAWAKHPATAQPLRLGNVAAHRDMGYAADTMEAVIRLMEYPEAIDVVVATGESHSIEALVSTAAEAAGLHWQWQGEGLERCAVDTATGEARVVIDPQFYRPLDPAVLVGNPTKAKTLLGWEPTLSFKGWVTLMVEAELAEQPQLAMV
jgi:GDPmannose 4,6-dehydratase